MIENGTTHSRGRFPTRFALMIPARLLLEAAAHAAYGAGVVKTDWMTRGTMVGATRGPGAPSVPQVPVGVGALGRLEPGWKVYQIGPAAADGSRVESLTVEAGDEVQPGQHLAVLDTHARRRAALEEADAQVLIARSRLDLVRAGPKPDEVAAQAAAVAKLEVALGHAEAALRRASALHQSGTGSADDYDLKKADADGNRELLRQSEATLAALKTVRPADVAAAEAELARATAGVARARAELDATVVCSPIRGRVLKVHARPSERVAESGLLELGDTAAMHAVAEVYERDALRVRTGQRAAVKVQSLTGELAGEVVHVGWKVGRQVVFDNDPVKDTDARVVEVRIKLDAGSSARVAGLTYARVEVRIGPTVPPAPEGR